MRKTILDWLASEVACWLPRRVVYFAALRVVSAATRPPYREHAGELNAVMALERWLLDS